WLGSSINARPALRASPVVVPSHAITASVGILSWPATIPLTRPPSMIRSSTLLSVMSEAPAFSACSASHLSNFPRFAVKLPSGSLDSNSTENALSEVMKVMPSFRTKRSMGASFHESPRSFLSAYEYILPPHNFFDPGKYSGSTSRTCTPYLASVSAADLPAVHAHHT